MRANQFDELPEPRADNRDIGRRKSEGRKRRVGVLLYVNFATG